MQGLRRGRTRPVLLGVIAGLCVFAFPAVAQSQVQQGEPWACDNVAYVTQFDAGGATGGNTLFTRADLQDDGTVDLVTLGEYVGAQLNAIGFRAQDGFMYGFINDPTGGNDIVRIGQDATGAPVFTSMGIPAASPVTSTVTGAILADGTYMVWQGATGAIFDVSGSQAVLLEELTGTAGETPGGDFAVNPADGEMYGVSTDPGGTQGLYRFELTGDTITREERVSDTIGGGAQWFLADGTFMSYLNSPGGIHRTNLETGEVTQVATGPDLSNVDGASCANTLALTKEANPRTVTEGDTLTYIYTVTSHGLFENEVDFADTLPAGMTYVPGGAEVSPQFGTVNDYGGTRTLEVSGTMTPGMEATITARVRVGFNGDCHADVENQAEATMSTPGLPNVTVVSDDPTTEDELDDPTVVTVNCGRPRVTVSKSANKGAARPGQQIRYRILVRNTGDAIARRTRVCDRLPAALQLVRAPGARRLSARRHCWTVSLRPGARASFRVIARMKPGASPGIKPNVATVNGAQIPRRRARAGVRATPTPVCRAWLVKTAC